MREVVESRRWPRAISLVLAVAIPAILILPAANASGTAVFSAPFTSATSVTFPRGISAHGIAHVRVAASPSFALSNGTATADLAVSASSSRNGTVQSLAQAEPETRLILPVTAANGGHFRVTVNVAATAHWSVVAGACALNASPTLYDSCEGDASVALFIRIAFLDGGNRSGERGQELVLIDNGSIAGGFCQFGYCTNFTSAYLSGSAAVTGTFTVALNGSFAQTNGTVQVTLIPDVIVVDQPFFTTLLGASSVATLRATVTIASIVQW